MSKVIMAAGVRNAIGVRLGLAAVLVGCAALAAAAEPWHVDLSGDWRFAPGDDPQWANRAFDDSEWEVAPAPALWDSFGYADYDGYGWYRRTFTAPASVATVSLRMEIGGVDDDDWVYINGRLIGQGKGCYQRRVYQVPPGVVQAGENLIAVRIYDGAMGGGLAVGPIALGEESLADRLELTVCRIEPAGAEPTEMALVLEVANKVTREQAVSVQGALSDYLRRPLGEVKTELHLAPEGTQSYRLPFKGGECTDYRLALSLTQGAEHWETFRYLQADAPAGPRKTWWLSGRWEFRPVEDLSRPPQDGWREIVVPMAQWGGWPGQEHSAWFRRTVAIPPQSPGERLRLRFEAVAHYCQVYLNGQRVGEHLGGFEPFWVDVTDAARPGADNELLVGVTDWTAGLKAGTAVPADLEKLPKGCMLIPYGSRPQWVRGIWQDVYLVAQGPFTIEGSQITTSVSRHELAVKLWVRNHGAEPKTVELQPAVKDAGQPVLALEKRRVTVPAAETVEVAWQQPWASPKLWWPSDPHLYNLRTEVKEGGLVTDVDDTRFGFREFAIDGKDYRLNGRVFRLRGLVCTPQGASRESIRDYLISGMAQKHFTLVRNHMGPRPTYYHDIADEVGMCLKDESAFYCAANTYALTDEAFWRNTAVHIDAMVRRTWNHPSVCIWSTENEILHCGGIGTPGTDAHIFELGQRIAALDPTRPIEYEGDGDMVGRAATVNIHYPREFGCHDHNLWPNDSWWLGHSGNDRWPQDLVWKGDKPLVMGEFCYYPYSRPPGGVSVFVGDRAYESRETERTAHAMGVRFVCEGARWSGVAGLNPWVGETIYGERCLPPIAAIIREWDHAFWTGEQVPRHMLVLNDTLTDEALELVVAVVDGQKALDRWSESRALPPGGRWEVPVTVHMPAQPGRYTLVAKLKRSSEVVYTEERALRVDRAAPVTAPDGLTVALFDPAGKSAKGLAAGGLTAKPVAELTTGNLADVGLLIIGQEAWGKDQSAGRDCLPAFVAAGGKVLVLPQTALPTWLPCGVRVDPAHGATMSYPCYPGHPAVQGVALDGRDLCWWRGDHLVARALLRKPQTGSFRILAEAGGRGGLLWSPLVELPHGRGWWILSQYLLDEKLDAEPVARQLLRNVLSYAAAYQAPGEVRVGTVASPALTSYLDGLGLAADHLDGEPTAEQLGAHDLVIVEGESLTASLAASLRTFAERGSTVWLHCPESANEEKVRALVPEFTRFGQADSKGHVTRIVQGGLASGLSNSDLFWYREDCWFEDWEGRGTGLVDDPCRTRPVLGKLGTVYARPGALAEVPAGRGRVVLDTLRLAEAAPAVAEKARRIGAVLLTNLGVALGEHSSSQAYRWEPLDLRSWLTTSLRDETDGDGQGGWTDQGANDLRAMPLGRHTLAGVEFDIADRCIALRSASHLTHAPAAVQSITVGARCDALAFLHAAAWASGNGQTIAVCQVHYDDGRQEEIAMADGVAVGDWWRPEELPMAPVGWRGANPVHEPVGLFRYVWRNPRPTAPIATLSVASGNTDAVYLLVAISRGEPK